MNHSSPQSTRRDGSIRLQVEDVNPLGKRDSNGDPGSSSTPTVHAPEKELTLFVLQLAVLQKMVARLGTLGFIWATVVLLGGFAIVLSRIDFWFLTIILLIEGTRIFSRSHELEWQHQSAWMTADGSMDSFKALKSSWRFIVRAMKGSKGPISVSQSRELKEKTDEAIPSNQPTRTWTSSELLSALACITLSVKRLVHLSHADAIKQSSDNKNEKSALIIFYSLALAEAFLSLLEKVYWGWKIHYRRLLEEVNKECEFGSSGMIYIKSFFYDAYSECVNGSIFDGLKLDLVSYATELLASDSSDEQLIGARILQKLSTNTRFSDDTLRKLGTSISHNSLRVAGIPGAMESISSLLYTQCSSDSASDEIGEKKIGCNLGHYQFCVFNQFGLTILKKLARNYDNCEKIGNTRGLLPKIIDFSQTGERLLRNSHDRDGRILRAKKIPASAEVAHKNIWYCGQASEARDCGDCFHSKQHQRNSEELLTKLVGALEDPVLRINSARILRNVCTYAGQDCFVRLKGVSAGAPRVLKAIMSAENKLQEVMLGLALQVFRFMNPQEASITFNQTGIDEAKLAMKLLEILKIYQYSSSKVPRKRRFAVEYAIWMMKNNKATVQTFKDFGMEEELEILRETTSEIESFDIFNGTIGLSQHSTAQHSTAMYILVDNALKLREYG
ncbi:hypothetical protein NE237_012502 [Protea cynaroides]|uniref:Uncharacterized protein n=1 Tax=Protea cynaroides TaxID=273540 RepID=A0A9Q0H208_9MAGN|nr:hypothetical protein NE237_012502 [Protea cynaroides]